MLKSLLRHRLLVFLLLLALLLKLFSLNEAWVERYYTYGVYPLISQGLRLILGWIPFSMGDILYVAAGLFLVLKVVKLFRLLFTRRLRQSLSWSAFRKYLCILLGIYVVFNLFWGLNYNRQGIAAQLGLDVRRYNQPDLRAVTETLHSRLNSHAALVDSIRRTRLDDNSTLFNEGVKSYERVRSTYPFLRYRYPSVKASLFGGMGKYFGYTGYYNPFSGEAQLKTSIPVFLKPFVVNHEIAHQLGYGKENEASFVSYLVSRESEDIDFRYSVYYELFNNAWRQCRRAGDTAFASALFNTLHPRVLADHDEQVRYLQSTRNPIEPFMSGAYDRYLRLNNQPKGKATYDEVTAWLIAYMRKYGREKL
jgi:hypothetical protein